MLKNKFENLKFRLFINPSQLNRNQMSQVQRFNTQKGPKAIGPYSTASIYRGVVYVSGQIGISPQTGELVGPDV